MGRVRHGELCVLFIAIATLFSPIARSDYAVPPFPEAVAETTSIVDATVLAHQESGIVRIRVHETLKGDTTPTTLGGAHYTCLGIDLEKILMVGQRYVLLLYNNGLYDETSFYETKVESGALLCRCWDGSRDYARTWMPVTELKRLVDAVGASAANAASAQSFGEELQAARRKGDDIDFQSLRYSWAGSSSCDSSYRDSSEFASLLVSLNVPDDQLESAADQCRHLPDRFFVDARLHVICANLAMALGDEEAADFHRRTYDGLLASIASSGDGKTLDTAFEVISPYEEYDFLDWSGLRVEKQTKQITCGSRLASVFDVRDEFGVARSVWFVRHPRRCAQVDGE